MFGLVDEVGIEGSNVVRLNSDKSRKLADFS